MALITFSPSKAILVPIAPLKMATNQNFQEGGFLTFNGFKIYYTSSKEEVFFKGKKNNDSYKSYKLISRYFYIVSLPGQAERQCVSFTVIHWVAYLLKTYYAADAMTKKGRERKIKAEFCIKGVPMQWNRQSQVNKTCDGNMCLDMVKEA